MLGSISAAYKAATQRPVVEASKHNELADMWNGLSHFAHTHPIVGSFIMGAISLGIIWLGMLIASDT